MLCSYAPRNQVLAWLRKGWRLVPGHDYAAEDWAVVMVLPETPDELTGGQINALAQRFRKPIVPVELGSNRKRGAASGSAERAAGRLEGRVYDKTLRRLVQA